jgi:hypothetical protein
MKKSSFSVGVLFLAAVVAISFVMGNVKAVAQAAIGYKVVTDATGNLIGQMIRPVSVAGNTATIEVETRTSAPPGVTMSSQAPAFTATPTTVTVTVPASVPVGFCSSGDYYNKSTGLCADGKFPYKIVPAGSLSDPAAQTPTLTCAAPKVPTFNPATKTWQCIVPTGFKLSLGN